MTKVSGIDPLSIISRLNGLAQIKPTGLPHIQEAISITEPLIADMPSLQSAHQALQKIEKTGPNMLAPNMMRLMAGMIQKNTASPITQKISKPEKIKEKVPKIPEPKKRLSRTASQIPVDKVREFVLGELDLSNNEVDKLSPLSTKGLYTLLRKGISPRDLKDFLQEFDNFYTEINYNSIFILELLAQLYDHQVKGFEEAFKRTRGCNNFFSYDGKAVNGLISHMQIALYFASNESVKSIEYEKALPCDQSKKPLKFNRVLKKFCDPFFDTPPSSWSKKLRYRKHDLFLTAKNGTTRIIEIKRSKVVHIAKPNRSQKRIIANMIAQAVFHVLTAKQNYLTGLEFVFISPKEPSKYFIKTFLAALRNLGIPFTIRCIYKGKKIWNYSQNLKPISGNWITKFEDLKYRELPDLPV
ncbi:hypothetical protein BVY03_01285 [bacterium K02(2017)]|nr:hypothetical protein BVY03_01285 [bacterium K02(2017)]